jgi:hypothetical protein
MIRYDKAARMLLLAATCCMSVKSVPVAIAKEINDSTKYTSLKDYSAREGDKSNYDVIYFESIYGNSDYPYNENKIYQHIAILNSTKDNINELSTRDGSVNQHSFHSYKYNFNFTSNYSAKMKVASFVIYFPSLDYTSSNTEIATCLSPDKLLNMAFKHGYHTSPSGLNWSAVAQYDALPPRYELAVYKNSESIKITAASAINFQGMCMLTISHSLKW